MTQFTKERATWREVLDRERLLQLPAVFDALSAKLVARAGYPALQIGGFAVEGALYGQPDADLTHLGEKSAAAARIIRAVNIPVLVDADDGYGDAKNVTRTVETYESMGAAAIFLEDQKPPKECGHKAGKVVVPVEAMVNKIRAACAARRERDALFVLARTDAREPEGLDKAIARAEAYARAGADGVYVEGPKSESELRKIGEALGGLPLATSILERGGVTPWTSPDALKDMGFSMVLYPTTLLFRAVRAVEEACADLKAAIPLNESNSADMQHYDEIVGTERWVGIQKQFHGGPHWDQCGS